MLTECEVSQLHGGRAETVSFLVDEATACIEKKCLCENACKLLRLFISMHALTANASRALSATFFSILESSDSIISRDPRLRSNVSFQISLLFVDLMNASSNSSTLQLGSFDKSSSSLLSSLFFYQNHRLKLAVPYCLVRYRNTRLWLTLLIWSLYFRV